MSSGFISEKELAEARLKRQEEWEKVRTADQPLEVPEEKYDSRSLFERLEEQRKKRDLEFEESRKLKNMIKGLDDDEIDFLDLVDQKKLEAERNKTMDEERELLDYRNRVANLQEQSMEQRLQAELKTVKKQQTSPTTNHNSHNRLSQNKLLKGGLVLKKSTSTQQEKTAIKRKLTNNILENNLNDNDEPAKKICLNNDIIDSIKTMNNSTKFEQDNKLSSCKEDELNGPHNSKENEINGPHNINEEKIPPAIIKTTEPVLKCVGILPGLGYYAENSSSDSDAESSDVEDVVFAQIKYDLTGRKIEEKNLEDS